MEFWDVTLYILLDRYQSSGWTCCLQPFLQWRWRHQVPTDCWYQIRPHHIWEDCNCDTAMRLSNHTHVVTNISCRILINIGMVSVSKSCQINLILGLYWPSVKPILHKTQIEFHKLRKLADAVMLLTCIWEVPGLNLDWNINCPDWGLSWFFTVSPGRCYDGTLSQAMTASFHTLSNSLFIYHPTAWPCIVWDTDSIN
jgi:hypothetical protein